MAHQNAEFAIDDGPPKLDLMLSLFDTDMGARTVRFHAPDWVHPRGGHEFGVEIVSARRRDPAATIWEIEGRLETPRCNEKERARVSIYYLSDIREGRMRFEEELGTHGIMETPDSSKRARAFLNIIEKMIATYRDSHPGNLDEKIFKLFEKAKAVNFADDRKSLARAIENI